MPRHNDIAAMFAAAAMDRDDDHGLTHEQHITRLTEFYAQVYTAEPETFTPGQIIWHKNPELATFNDAREPHLFVEYLEKPVDGLSLCSEPEHLFGHTTAIRVDCRVMRFCDGTACTHVLDSRQFTATAPRVKS